MLFSVSFHCNVAVFMELGERNSSLWDYKVLVQLPVCRFFGVYSVMVAVEC